MAECIEREATIKRIEEVYCVGCNSYNGVRCRACGTGDAIDMIEDAPTADVAPVVHGWWEKEPSSSWRWTPSGAVAVTRTTYRCGLCGRGTAVKSNYCPNCGAKMDRGADHDA